MFGADASVSGAAQAGGYFNEANDTVPEGNVFGPGTVGRWMLIEWIISVIWLVIIWRVIDGY
jgi:hypothetical protein